MNAARRVHPLPDPVPTEEKHVFNDSAEVASTQPNVCELPRHHPSLDLAPRNISAEQWRRFERHVGEMLTAFGLPLGTPGTRITPERFVRALYDATAGYDGDPKLLTAFPSETGDELDAPLGQIIEGPIEFSSLCEHHALPFHGHIHIGYIPDEQIIGISKLTRLARVFARRFTVQERLGEQIADTLVALIEPCGVAVHIEASHLCTQMRGVEEHSRTTTTFWRGAFHDPDLRREFLDEVHRRRSR